VALDGEDAPRSGELDFREAKRRLRAIYAQASSPVTLYGGCPLVVTGAGDAPSLLVDWTRCCHRPSDPERARLEWEHAVPAATLGGALSAWREGDPRCTKRGKPFRGRRCARRVSAEFRRMEGDMHNLFPAIGELNAARAALAPGLVPGEPRAFGSCDFEIDATHVEPRPAARGDLARAYLYMDARYPASGILASAELRALVEIWQRDDPPDDWERARNRLIAAAQGNPNPFIGE
jgi:deoxyribonuclease-1